MSFTGLFRAKDGIAAVVDSKATLEIEKGRYEEHIGRKPEKMFHFPNGIALTYGANQIHVQAKGRVFSQVTIIEDIVYEYLRLHPTLDANFFQGLIVKMNSSPSNTEPIRFLIARKLWAGRYQIEYHKVGRDYYAMKIGSEADCVFVGGAETYVQAFHQMDFRSRTDSAESMRSYAAGNLQKLIDFYDETLAYNPVGGDVKSFILR